MPPRYLRPLLVFEFLIAMQVVFTCWSQIGGQYHLDLMFWPWKLGLSSMASLLITGITGNLVRANGAVSKKAWFFGSLLLVTVVVAGLVTYYYHLNESGDEDNSDEQPITITRG